MKKISVIVPVYNSEKYIERCLTSIINQTYKNIEIIIINDGSTDNSQGIIDKYVKENQNTIKTYQTKNNGVASARNLGIEKVTGDYFLFVDSDDYIEQNLIEKLNSIIEKEKVDIVKYKMKIIKENNTGEISAGPVFEKTSGEDAFNKLCYTDKMIDTPCLYLFNTEYFKNNSFKFTENTYHEDFGLIPLVIVKANSFISTKICGYCYIYTDDSITRNKDNKKAIKKANDLLFHYDNMKHEIETYSISKCTKENIYSYYINALLLRIKELNGQTKKEYIQEIKKRNILTKLKTKGVKGFLKYLYYKCTI